MAGALDGIEVVDLTQGPAGALASMFLADHGARVIRVVETTADVLRGGGYRIWDRGKEAVLCQSGEHIKLAALIAAADVVIEDFSPAQRPGHLAADRLSQDYPRLITCSITAYGEHGALCDEPPVDDLVLARLGVLAGLPGFRDGPVHAAHPLPSVGAGLLAAIGIAAALYQREETGCGRHVATSLVAGALLYHPKVVGEHLQPNVFQTNPFGSAPFYSVYECADGHWIQLGCVHPGFIARAADLMGIGDVLADPVYGKGQAPLTTEADNHLRDLIHEVMIMRAAADWIADFERLDIPFAPAQSNEEGMADPQVAHNNMLVTLPDPELGTVEAMGAPIKMSATPSALKGGRRATAIDMDKLQIEFASNAPSAVVANAQPSTRLPLGGIRVLEITNLIAGPIAGRLLADLGADVIKLEPPAGDISRPIGRTYFYSINYAKRSVAVDTAADAGKAIVRRLAQTCDVVLANLRPGATTRMGLGVEHNPQIIETQISGYGLTGPYAHRPGIDPLAQALMGMERAQGGTGNPPSFTAQLAPTDFTTGTMAALGTVMALFARRRGVAQGQRVAVNLLDGAIVLSSEWFARYAGKPERLLADKGQHGPHPFHRLYRCRDGYIYVAADAPCEQAALLQALRLDAEPQPEHFAVTDDVHPNESALAQALSTAFAGLDVAAATTRLKGAGIPSAPALPPESEVFFDDPSTAANGWSVTQRHPTAGNLTAVCRYVQFEGAQDGREAIRPTPLLGQHVDEALTEAGYTADEIATFHAEGLVVTRTTGP